MRNPSRTSTAWRAAAGLALLLAGCGGDRRAVILRDLAGDNPVRREQAVEAAGRLVLREAAPRLLELAAPGQPAALRARSIRALGDLGEPAALPLLADALTGDDDACAREAAAALGRIGDRKAAAGLLAALPESPATLEILWALGQLGDPAAMPALTGLLKADDPFIRYNAAQALKRIGN